MRTLCARGARGATPAASGTHRPSMATSLDSLLTHIDDPKLRAQIRAAASGLVFERLPEPPLPLPKAAVAVGLHVLVDGVAGVRQVTALEQGVAVLGDGAVVPVNTLTVVRLPGETLLPALQPLAEVSKGEPGDPVHTIINGENLHALQLLQSTHAGLVDLIYIDPPYNTGSKTWTYNDQFGSAKDAYRHATWLSFMERRLRLAKTLLTRTGLIIVSIDDNEHHRLRMLLDEVFGEKNFIANITWQGGPSSLAKHTSGGVDYMLVYAAERPALPSFQERKPYAGDMVTGVASARAAGVSRQQVERELKQFISVHRADMQPGLRSYNTIDEQWRIYSTTNMDNAGYRPNLKYPITDPATGKVFASPHNGWKVSEAVTLELIADNRLTFTGISPRRKNLLTEYLDGLPAPTFTADRGSATRHLQNILGDKRFPFPKDHNVLMRWFRMVAPHDAVILDFFGGSGSTAEAVIRLNAEDGGTRQTILVTNNELSAADDKRLRAAGHRPGDTGYEAHGVFHRVTRPRLTTVVTGVRHDGSTYSDGVAANVTFFELDYQDSPTDLDGLLWLTNGGTGPLLPPRDTSGYTVSEDRLIAVLYDPTAATALLAELDQRNGTHVFVLADNEADGETAASFFEDNYIVERIYGHRLHALRLNAG